MLTMKLSINGESIMEAEITRMDGEDGGLCKYTAFFILEGMDGFTHNDGFDVEHNHSDGAEVLAKKVLEKIIEIRGER